MLKDKFGEPFEREACHLCAEPSAHLHALRRGADYLVMELVEEALLKGPLSGKAIEYVGQILDALEATHSRSTALCPLTAGTVSISAAETNMCLLFGSKIIVLPFLCVGMSSPDSYASALFCRPTDTVPSPFEAKINLLSASKRRCVYPVDDGKGGNHFPAVRIHNCQHLAPATYE
jgi:hypothetical protein